MSQVDAFGKHEVLDRASIVLELFSEKIASHEAVKADPELNALAEEIENKLHDFYQAAGKKSL